MQIQMVVVLLGMCMVLLARGRALDLRSIQRPRARPVPVETMLGRRTIESKSRAAARGEGAHYG